MLINRINLKFQGEVPLKKMDILRTLLGKLNETLKDGQELPYCDGIHVDCWGFNVQYQWSS